MRRFLSYVLSLVMICSYITIVRAENDEILFQGIPWNISFTEFNQTIVDMQLSSVEIKEHRLSDRRVYLSPSEKMLKSYKNSNIGITKFFSSSGNGCAVCGSFKSDKTLGGLDIQDIYCSFVYIIDEEGNINTGESRLFSVYIDFKNGQNGKDFLNVMRKKYGKPKSYGDNRFPIYVWEGKENTRVLYAMNGDWASSIMYVNTAVSDYARTMIEAHVQIEEEKEDMGV